MRQRLPRRLAGVVTALNNTHAVGVFFDTFAHGWTSRRMRCESMLASRATRFSATFQSEWRWLRLAPTSKVRSMSKDQSSPLSITQEPGTRQRTLHGRMVPGVICGQ
jgi:hypothetical protein